jgi:hypothetical protein
MKSGSYASESIKSIASFLSNHHNGFSDTNSGVSINDQ